MLKRKEIISRLLATTMVLSTVTSSVSALEPRATVSSSTLAGADRYETAVKVSESGWTSATNAVIINGDKGLVDALTATPYASLKNAPILVTEKDKLTKVTKDRLTKLGVKNVDIVGGEAVVSQAVENELKAMGLKVNRIKGEDRYSTSVAVANEIKKLTTVNKIAVVNGATGLPDAVSIAAPAADNKMPIILSDPANNNGISEAKSFIESNNISKSYVIGQTSAVSNNIMNTLPGTKTRLGGSDRHETNAQVIKEFYTQKELDNIYVAKSGYIKNNEELVDALAVGVLAAKNDDPVLIVGNNLGDTQETLLKDKKFTKITQVGNGIPAASIQHIKDTQKDPEAKVTKVTLVNYNTIKITGEELNRLYSSSITMSGNTVLSYTSNTAGTEATVVFSKSFNGGTNTITVKSNLGNSTNHSFTYSTAISSVEAVTSEISQSGVQYLEFTVNGGQTKTIDELKSLGWTVKFTSNKSVFYNDVNPTTTSTISSTGKLKTSEFSTSDDFYYEVTLTNGTQNLKSDRKVVTVSQTDRNLSSIKSQDLIFTNGKINGNKLVSNKMLTGETVRLSNVKGILNNGETTNIDNSDLTVASSDSSVLTVSKDNSNNINITARKVGTSTLTIKKGNITKTISIQVLNGIENTRTVSSVKVYDKDTTTQRTSVKLSTGATNIEYTLRAYDQYGDPINSAGNISTIQTTGTNSKVVATSILGAFTNGKATLTLNADATNTGTGTLKFTTTSGTTTKTLGSISVVVSVPTNSQTYGLDIVESGKDLKLDRYAYKADDSLTLQLKNYDSNGMLKPQIDITSADYVVKSSNTNIVTVSKVSGTEGKVLVVPTANKTNTGTATVGVYKKDGTKETLLKSVTITVVDTTPVIESISMKTVDTITKVKTTEKEFKITDLLNISYSELSTSATDLNNENHYKKIVEGVKVKGYENQEVLLHIPTGSSGEAILFIDRKDSRNDFNGIYDSGTDFILGTLKIELSTVKGTISNGEVKLDNNTPDGTIIVGLYDGEYSPSKNPKDTTIEVKIAR